jgi:hypothetical protein
MTWMALYMHEALEVYKVLKARKGPVASSTNFIDFISDHKQMFGIGHDFTREWTLLNLDLLVREIHCVMKC